MPFCRICDQYMFESDAVRGGHRCPPEWELLQEDELNNLGRGPWPENKHIRPPEWALCYGTDEEEACEKWAEKYDQNGDYTIVSGRHGAEIVYIRKPVDDDFIGPTLATKWSIEGESVPRYSADRCAPEKEVKK